jgi:S1-C subfamily serine protease
MSLADTVARCRSGIFQIAFANAQGQKIGGGTAFLTNNHLVTNHHVFLGHNGAAQVGLRRDDMIAGQFHAFTPQDFASRLVTGSQEQSYDYAVLRIPELVQANDHQFSLERPGNRRIGDDVALLGFPLEHDNLTCHSGKISSFYQSGIAQIIQIDASVNAGNSGGPLIDPETGVTFGIVTRKATGLSRIFAQLKQSVQNNVRLAQAATGGISIGGIDPVGAFVTSQHQLMATLDEIERQANVGIGYAFSAEHVLAEPCIISTNP